MIDLGRMLLGLFAWSLVAVVYACSHGCASPLPPEPGYVVTSTRGEAGAPVTLSYRSQGEP